ncbi:hypothetical protein ACFL35_02170 [Candidatus Riflebacteria bacterium]
MRKNIFFLITGIMFFFLGCNGSSSNTGVTTSRGMGRLTVKQLKYSVRAPGQVKSSIRALIDPGDIGAVSIYAQAESLDTGEKVEKQVDYVAGGKMLLENVPVGPNKLIVQARSERGTALLSASTIVDVIEGDTPTVIEAVVLLSGDGDSISGAPEVQEIQVTDITGDSISFFWLTNEPCLSWVQYNVEGSDITANEIAVSTTAVTNHFVTISGLLADTIYTGRVKVTDLDGLTTYSEPDSFDLNMPLITQDFSITLKDGGNYVFSREIDIVIDAAGASTMLIYAGTEEISSTNSGDFTGAPIPYSSNYHLTLPETAGQYYVNARFFDENGVILGHGSLGVYFDDTPIAFVSLPYAFTSLNFAEIIWSTNKPTREAYVMYHLKGGGTDTRVDGISDFSGEFSGTGYSGPTAKIKTKADFIKQCRDYWFNKRQQLLKGKLPIKISPLIRSRILTSTQEGNFINSALLDGLTANTEYEYAVFVVDFTDIELKSDIYTFVTVEPDPFDYQFLSEKSLWGGIASGAGNITNVGGIAAVPDHFFDSNKPAFYVTQVDGTRKQIQAFDANGDFDRILALNNKDYTTQTVFNTAPGKLVYYKTGTDLYLYIIDGDDLVIYDIEYDEKVGELFASDDYPSPAVDVSFHPNLPLLYILGAGGEVSAFDCSTPSAPTASVTMGIPSIANWPSAMTFSSVGPAAGYPASLTFADDMTSSYPPMDILASVTPQMSRIAADNTAFGGSSSIFDLDYHGGYVYYSDPGDGHIGKFNATTFDTSSGAVTEVPINALPGAPAVPLCIGAGGSAVAVSYSGGSPQASVVLLDKNTFSYQKEIAWPFGHPQGNFNYKGKPHFDQVSGHLYVPCIDLGVKEFDIGAKDLLMRYNTDGKEVVAITQGFEWIGTQLENRELYVLCGSATTSLHVYKFNLGATTAVSSYNLTGGPYSGEFTDIAFGSNGYLYLIHKTGGYILVINAATLAPVTSISEPAGAAFSNPEGIAIMHGPPDIPTDIDILIADTGNKRIILMKTDGTLINANLNNTALNGPRDVFYPMSGAPIILVADHANPGIDRIVVLDEASGDLKFQVDAASTFAEFWGITGGPNQSSGRVFVSDSYVPAFHEFDVAFEW